MQVVLQDFVRIDERLLVGFGLILESADQVWSHCGNLKVNESDENDNIEGRY